MEKSKQLNQNENDIFDLTNEESSNDEDYEDEDEFDFDDNNVDLETLFEKYLYDDEKKRNIVHVGIEIKRAIEKQTSVLNKLLERLINKTSK